MSSTSNIFLNTGESIGSEFYDTTTYSTAETTKFMSLLSSDVSPSYIAPTGVSVLRSITDISSADNQSPLITVTASDHILPSTPLVTDLYGESDLSQVSSYSTVFPKVSMDGELSSNLHSTGHESQSGLSTMYATDIHAESTIFTLNASTTNNLPNFMTPFIEFSSPNIEQTHDTTQSTISSAIHFRTSVSPMLYSTTYLSNNLLHTTVATSTKDVEGTSVQLSTMTPSVTDSSPLITLDSIASLQTDSVWMTANNISDMSSVLLSSTLFSSSAFPETHLFSYTGVTLAYVSDFITTFVQTPSLPLILTSFTGSSTYLPTTPTATLSPSTSPYDTQSQLQSSTGI